MKTADVVNVLEIVNLAAKYGTPLVLDIINNWNDEEEITPAKIAELKASIKPASELFED